MKRYAIALTLLAFGIATNPSRAETATAGAGTFTCAAFTQASVNDPAGEPTYFTWAQGFMSGMDAAELINSGQSANLSSEPLKEQERAVRRYCSDNPNKLYEQAVIALFRTLPKNALIKNWHKTQ
jgi:hypothetical protein